LISAASFIKKAAIAGMRDKKMVWLNRSVKKTFIVLNPDTYVAAKTSAALTNCRLVCLVIMGLSLSRMVWITIPSYILMDFFNPRISKNPNFLSYTTIMYCGS
jgi:hypothetical protein